MGKKVESVTDYIFLGSKSLWAVIAAMKLKDSWAFEGRKAMTNLDSILKSRDIILLTKVCLVEAPYGFSSSFICMWELDHKEAWAPKNWCFQTGAGEDSRESFGQQGDQTNQS